MNIVRRYAWPAEGGSAGGRDSSAAFLVGFHVETTTGFLEDVPAAMTPAGVVGMSDDI